MKEYQRFRSKPECGTRSGYDYHRRALKEDPCELCAEAERSYHRERRVRDSVKLNADRRAWKRAHPNVRRTVFTMEEIVAVYGTCCHYCGGEIDFDAPRAAGTPGWEKAYHPDHLIPLSKNGPDVIENIRPSHAQCNMRKWATVDVAIVEEDNA